MPARVGLPDQAWRIDPSFVRRTEVRHHEHGVHQLRLRQHLHELPRPHLAEVRAVDRGEHERLPRRAALVDARELHQRGGVGGAARRLGDGRGVARRDDHDLPARGARAAPDHVHEVASRVREALHDRARAAAAPEAARLERVGHELGRWPGRRACPARRSGACAAMRVASSVAWSAVEQHVGGQSLRQRPRPALEREHRQHERQKRRHEGRAVDPRLDHGALNLQSGGDVGNGPTDPARRRRAVRTEAAHLSAAQGGL